MKYNRLGETGLNVSAISLGTAALGIGYGINIPESRDKLDPNRIIKLIMKAHDQGINYYDTAPVYGNAEYLLGQAIGQKDDCLIATKIPPVFGETGKRLTGQKLKVTVMDSIEMSLRLLKRDALDILQIHNATEEVIKNGELTEILIKARGEGKIRFLGASVYGQHNALAVINDGHYKLLQVAYNILDRRMEKKILPAAGEAGIGVVARSVLLKGVLTPRAPHLPKELEPLFEASQKLLGYFSCSWEKLPYYAIRFCLSNPYSLTNLVGISSAEELTVALDAEKDGGLDSRVNKELQNYAVDDFDLVNPVNWSLP